MRKLINILILLVTITAQASAAPSAVVTVRPGTEVAGSKCMLGEIANFGKSETDLTDRLKNVFVCTSPLPGKTRKITRNQIVVAVRRAGIKDSEIDLLCPFEIKITRKAVKISGEALFTAVKEYALKSNTLPGRVEIRPMRLPKDLEAPVGKLVLDVQPGYKGIRGGQISIPVKIKVDGSVYRKISVTIQVKVFAPVLISTQVIKAGTEFSAKNTTILEREITTSINDTVTDEGIPFGKISAASIPSGAIIRKRWIKEPPVILSGDKVVVIVESGAITITDKGTAIQNGCPGDSIKVRLNGNIRTIRGRVVKSGIVKISQVERNR